MEKQKCSNCSAPMVLIHNYNGTDSYKCEYCGQIIDIRPKTASEHIFAFVNKTVNAVSKALSDDDSQSSLSPEKKAEFDQRIAAANEKRKEAYERYMEKKSKLTKSTLRNGLRDNNVDVNLLIERVYIRRLLKFILNYSNMSEFNL